MALALRQADRNVIPRWRDFATTVELGELTEPASRRTPKPLQFELGSLEEDWANNRSLSFAADLLCAASLRSATEVVREAANFVLDSGTDLGADHPLIRLAKQTLQHDVDKDRQNRLIEAYTATGMNNLISSHRRSLKIFPRDAILWVDLSLLYAMQGLSEKARRAMLVAISLEPENRFVLRSASRLFIHLNEPDRAHKLLRRSNLVKCDPWIISAEIATALAAKLPVFSVDQGIRTAAGSNFDHRQTTELSTALASLELRDGNRQKARKHLRNALRKPNENSLAQAKWVSRQMNDLRSGISVTEFQVERSFEAAAWEATLNRDWTSAAENSIGWLKDQPFSSRPAQLGAHVTGALLENFDAAEKITKLGLNANRGEHLLQLSLAFIYGSTNRLELAREHLAQIRGPMINAVEIAVIADHGLIKFREGDEEAGRAFYQAAVETALDRNENVVAASALIYWAREEVRSRTPVAGDVLARAASGVKAQGSALIEGPFLIERIEREFALSKVKATP